MIAKLDKRPGCPSVQKGIYLTFSAFFLLTVFVLFSGLFSKLNPSQLFVLGTWTFLIYAVCISSIELFFLHSRVTVLGYSDFKLFLVILAVSLVSGPALECLTLIGAVSSTPFDLDDWDLKRVLIFSLLTFMAFNVYLRVVKPSRPNRFGRIFSFFCGGKCIKLTLILLGGAFIASIFAFILEKTLKVAFIPSFLLSLSLLFSLSVLGSKRLVTLHSEWLFLGVALSFGCFIALQIPAMTGVSWDDQIHFRNALSLSYLTSPEKTDVDVFMEDMAVLRVQGNDVGIDTQEWDSEEIEAYYDSLSDAYNSDVVNGNVTSYYDSAQLLSFTTIGYIPSAIGLWLGRLFHLSYPVIIMFGRLGNLLFYCGICFCAIRITPVKKTLFSVVGLLPTNLFLAANYSYDPWIVACLMLSVALLLREMWGNSQKLSFGRLVAPVFIMLMGLCVKAVYFPIIGLFFLMPKEKFETIRQRRIYYLLVVAFGLFVLASFALPYLFTVDSDSGDTRGGSGVNPVGQLVYIVSNPVEYAQTLFRFFAEWYFNPAASDGYTTFFAYLSNSDASLAARSFLNKFDVLFLVSVAVLDGMDDISRRRASIAASVWTLFLFICSFILVATALYVSFTPVGLDTVNGCQQRYILPWLAPGLALIFNVGIPVDRIILLRRISMLMSVLMLSSCMFFDVLTKLVI